jgi:hypothetical protein
VYTLDTHSTPKCVASPAPEDYYGITVADLTQFVSATVTKEARDSRLDAEVIVASDGTRQLSGQVYDTSMGGLPCALDFGGNQANPTFTCLPGSVAVVQDSSPQYDDANCSTLVANESNFATCQAPSVVIEIPPGNNGCSLTTNTYYHVGTDVTAGNICSKGVTAPCSCHTDTSGAHYFTLGAAIDATTLAALALVKQGTGRLRAELLGDAMNVPLTGAVPGGYWDTTAGTSCQLRTFSDMSVHCVPDSALTIYSGNSAYYSDANCMMQPLVAQYVDATCPSPAPTALVFIQQATGACGVDTVTAVNSVGATYTGSTVYSLYNGQCQSNTVNSNEVYYQVGAVLPSSTFGAVVEKTE